MPNSFIATHTLHGNNFNLLADFLRQNPHTYSAEQSPYPYFQIKELQATIALLIFTKFKPMLELTIVQKISLWILPILLAVTVHEAAHGWVASRLGDNTARLLGRLTFNPIKHIDVIGTIIVPIVVLIISNFNFVFGWAKPVPIDSRNFKNPRRDVALATAAGPLANLIMAILWAGLVKIGLLLLPVYSSVALFLVLSANAGIVINLLLAFLNLLPIPPLDGGRILVSVLPYKQASLLAKIEPYGFFILLILLFTNVINWIIISPIMWSEHLLKVLFHIPHNV